VRWHTWALSGAAASLLLVTGCHHRAEVSYAPPPPIANPNGYPEGSAPPSPAPPGAEAPPTGRPLYSEVGIASWYGPPYNRRRGANGQIYDQNAVTAAHRTLPMGSLIRVTNLQNGRSAMMRVTDRGPFVPGRVLDLSVGAAKLLGVWRPGTARVRIDVYQTPEPLNYGGRWCVQIGAFTHAGAAKKLEEHLEREYETANVIEFTGPTGHWVRIRPENGDRERAIEIVNHLRPSEGAAYLVRLN
jgi:peptidoglycan lytic transglycosylase